jgi:hypothetical protein
MLDFNALFEFSRTHCIAICAFLVPANLVATSLTMVLTVLQRNGILRSASIAGLFAGLMVLHVLTWFMVGVVMLPTFVLSALAIVCCGINLWAVLGRNSLANFLAMLVKFCTRVDLPLPAHLHE